MAPDRRNRLFALGLAGVAVAMVGFAYASVPLYRVFCRVTGYGGTTQVATSAPKQSEIASDRVIKIRFNADIAKDLPWGFRPLQKEIALKVGETGLALYHAANHGGETIVGTAVFNVTPQKAGLYFDKTACFCFTEQTLAPGEEKDMPVSFFVDPEIVKDPNLDDVTTITLSYTFFRLAGEGAGPAAKSAARTPEPATLNSTGHLSGETTDG